MTDEEERELNSIGVQMFGKQLIMLDDAEMAAVLTERAAQQRLASRVPLKTVVRYRDRLYTVSGYSDLDQRPGLPEEEIKREYPDGTVYDLWPCRSSSPTATRGGTSSGASPSLSKSRHKRRKRVRRARLPSLPRALYRQPGQRGNPRLPGLRSMDAARLLGSPQRH
jgi:hypothetical protein